MEVRDIGEEAGIKTIPKTKKCKRRNGCLRRPTNSSEKKRSKRLGRKRKIYPFEYRVPKNSKEK